VVGVVDTAYASIRLGRPAVIFRQNLAELLPGLLADRPLDFVVRADDPDGVRRSVRARVSSAFPDAPAIHIVSGRELVEADLGRERLSAWFLSGVGAVAWLLGVSSVFGLVAYVAHSRRRDYGVMLALGADSRRLIRLAVGTALEPVAAGAVAGLAGALVLGRTVEAFLLGIAGVDLATYAIVFSGFVLTAAAAGVLAAWRLRRLSPGVALRTE
jgi:predicted lysophospholipase L1 biosynthesis ABC-type transport system permease subunit